MGIEGKVTELFELMEMLPRKAPQNVLDEFNRGEFFILNYLHANGGTAYPSKMSDAMQTSTARTAAALKGLESKGFITREPNAEDHRRKLVHLTPKGAEYIKNCREKLHRKITTLLTALGEEDATEYIRLMKKIITISHTSKIEE